MTNRGVLRGLQAGTPQRVLPSGRVQSSVPYTDVSTSARPENVPYTDLSLAHDRFTASALVVRNRYRQSTESLAPEFGTSLLIDWRANVEHKGAALSGPGSQTGWFGPRGLIHTQGIVTQSQNTTALGLGPIGVTHMIQFGNRKGSGAINITPSWGFINGQINVADGATLTMNPTDIYLYGSKCRGGAAFVDSTVWVSRNTGRWEGTTNTTDFVGFLSYPVIGGDTRLSRRIAFMADDFLPTGGSFMAPLLGTGGNTMDADAPAIGENIGFYVPRLANGTANIGLHSDSPLRLWSDTNTFSAQPALPAIQIGGTHTLDFSNATGPTGGLVSITGTWKFKQAGYALGGIGFLGFTPTVTNDSSLSAGTSIPLQILSVFSPTYSGDNTTGAQTYADVRSQSFSFTTSRAAGSGTFTITNLTDSQFSGTVGANTTVTTRRAIYIKDLTNSGTVTNNIGLDIDAFSVGATLALGIRNASKSVLSGGVYGDTASGGNLTLSPTTNSTQGDIKLDGPTVYLMPTNYTNGGSSNYTAIRSDYTVTMSASGGAGGTGNGFFWLNATPTLTYSTQGNVFGGYTGLREAPTIKNAASSGSINLGGYNGFSTNPTFNANDPGAATTVTVGQHAGVNIGVTLSRTTSGTMTLTSSYGVYASAPVVAANTTIGTRYDLYAVGAQVAGTVTTRAGLRIDDGSGAGTFTTQYGIDIASLTAAGTNVSIRVSGSAPILLAPKTSFGSSSTAATWNAHVMGGNSAATGLGLDTSTTGPTAPSSNAAGVLSIYKGTTNYYLLCTFNDGGTTRYRYMQLNGTGATWTHGTTLPT